jgi:hypothetical protein
MVMTRDSWHLDKTVNVSIILVLLLQFAAAVVWYSSVNNRLDNVEKAVAGDSTQEKRLIQLETKFDFIKETLSVIAADLKKNQLDREKTQQQ